MERLRGKNGLYWTVMVKKGGVKSKCVYCGKIIKDTEKYINVFENMGHRMSKLIHLDCLLNFNKIPENELKRDKNIVRQFWLSPYDVMELLGWDVPGEKTRDYINGLLNLLPYGVYMGKNNKYPFFFFYIGDLKRLDGYSMDEVIDIGKQFPVFVEWDESIGKIPRIVGVADV